MPRRQLLRRFQAYLEAYVVGFSLLCMGSCSNGPKVRVEISTPSQDGVEWYDENTGQSGFTPYSGTDKHVCFSPTDIQTLLDYCGLSGSPQAKKLLEVIK